MNSDTTQAPQVPAGNDRDATLPPTLMEVVVVNAKRASISALVLSLLFHGVAWLIAAMVVIGHGSAAAGSGNGDSGQVEMAVVTEGELTQLQDQALGVQTPTVPDAPMKDIEVATNINDTGPADAGGRSGDEIGEVGPLAGGGDISMGGGEGSGLGGSGGGGASFFGVEAQGNRFAYIVDVSGSMNDPVAAEHEGTRIQALRAELTRSTQGLLETSHFVIVDFSSDAEVLGEKKEWNEASPAEKKKYKDAHYHADSRRGRTNPMPAL